MGFPSSRNNAVADIDAFLANPEIDAVSVALPNQLHAENLPKVIASGKHLSAEKPIGRTREEAGRLADLADASEAFTGVGFSFRRLPGLAALAQALQGGAIGKVHTVRAWYNAADPAGALSRRTPRNSPAVAHSSTSERTLSMPPSS